MSWTTLISDNLCHLPFPVPYQLVGELESALPSPPPPHELAVGADEGHPGVPHQSVLFLSPKCQQEVELAGLSLLCCQMG